LVENPGQHFSLIGGIDWVAVEGFAERVLQPERGSGVAHNLFDLKNWFRISDKFQRL